MRGLPDLTRRLVLEAPQQAPDGAGGFTEGWAVLGALWAEVTPGTGRERAGEVTPLSRVPYRITVRGAPVEASYRPKPGQRFRDGARIFSVLAVAERDGRGHYLTCFAQEEDAA